MDDEIVFQIQNPQQFWSELEDTIGIPATSNLALLDGALRKFVLLCAGYHEQYLQVPLQFDHACDILLDSEVFNDHSGRMTNLLIQDATTNTDPHAQLVLHRLLLSYGYRTPTFLRSHKKWEPLIPILMDHLTVDFDPDDEFFNTLTRSTNTAFRAGPVIPIEEALRSLAVEVLYQICRVQKLDLNELRVFDDPFISTLFDLVEQTKDLYDDSLNYSIIKLLIALNEQFMLASLPTHKHQPSTSQDANQKAQNRVFVVLLRRLHYSRTFGQNIIFMLNRADSTNPEDNILQLLILKVLYLLFTTPGTQEYFYINDLRVLVDVFIRNLSDLGDENDSLRHTYLRVLHPLLTNTQLRNNPYKGVQILRTLERLVDKADIRDVSSTTKRLVDRCLGGEWCINLRRNALGSPTSSITTPTDSSSDHAAYHTSLTGSSVIKSQGGTTHFIVTAASSNSSSTTSVNVGASSTPTSASRLSTSSGGTKERSLKTARSFGDLKSRKHKDACPPPIPTRGSKGTTSALLMASSDSTNSATSLLNVSVSAAGAGAGANEQTSKGAKYGKEPGRSSTDPEAIGSHSHASVSGHGSRKEIDGITPHHHSTHTSSSSSVSSSTSSHTHARGHSHSHSHSHSSAKHRVLAGYQNGLNASTPSLTTTVLASSHSLGSVTNGGGGEQPKRRKPPPIPARNYNVKGLRSTSASISAGAQ